MKRVLFLLIVLTSIGFAVAKTGGVVDLSIRRESSTAEVGPRTALREGVSGPEYGLAMSEPTCPSAHEISNALRQFASENKSEIDQARVLLLNKSRESQKCREQVVAALMKALDQPNLDFTEDKHSYYLWRYGAELLGELKAAEALDLLISHLGLVNRAYFSTSMHHQPALRGVIKMGSIAIPKLDHVLRHSPDPSLRRDAVYCIATIGGPSAVHSLSQAFDLESDKCVSRFIRVSLDSFDDNGNIKDRIKWFSGLKCDE